MVVKHRQVEADIRWKHFLTCAEPTALSLTSIVMSWICKTWRRTSGHELAGEYILLDAHARVLQDSARGEAAENGAAHHAHMMQARTECGVHTVDMLMPRHAEAVHVLPQSCGRTPLPATTSSTS